MAIVSIKSQQVTIYDADGWILRAPVSSGTTGRETPAGVFSVVEKDKDHHSNLYDDASMPNMQRITWSGIALHGGPLPGHAASHGCVRMPYGFAEKLFDKTHVGMRVIIAPNDVEPVEFSDPALFAPNAAALAAAPARAETLAREAAEAATTADEAKSAAAVAARAAAPLTASLRKLEWLKSRAAAELAFAEKVLAAARTNQAKAEGLKQKAAAKAAGAGDAARRRQGRPQIETRLGRGSAGHRRSGARGGAARGVCAQAGMAQDPRRRRARVRREGAGRCQDEPDQSRGPETEGRRQSRGARDAVRHRQGRREVEARRRRGGAGRRQGGRGQAGRRRQSGTRGKARARAGLDLHQPRYAAALCAARLRGRTSTSRSRSAILTSASARMCSRRWRAPTAGCAGLRSRSIAADDVEAALDRISIPQDVLDRIAPTALPRSSIVISDEPLNRETNYRTEFVVVLNNQPQGGLAMRKRPDDVRVAGSGLDDFFGSFHWGNWTPNGLVAPHGGQDYYRRQW